MIKDTAPAESIAMHQPPPSPSRPAPDATSSPARLPAFTTDSLFQGQQEILIRHNGEPYRLRITRNGKLILTK